MGDKIIRIKNPEVIPPGYQLCTVCGGYGNEVIEYETDRSGGWIPVKCLGCEGTGRIRIGIWTRIRTMLRGVAFDNRL